MKKIFLFSAILFLATRISAQQPKIQGVLKELFSGPATPQERDAGLSEMKQ